MSRCTYLHMVTWQVLAFLSRCQGNLSFIYLHVAYTLAQACDLTQEFSRC